MRWALIHPASGAIVMVTTARATPAPDHLERRAAPTGIDAREHWWDGWSFAPRVDAPIAADPVGGSILIDCPADAWLSFPDGVIGMDRTMAIPARRARVAMVGRYRGEAWIEAAV